MTATFKDFIAALPTSGYKWLTSTLLAAQQAFAVRPYFTAKIIDDTIQPLAQLFSGAGTPLGQGSMCVAPDGTAFAVGLDGSNNLCVFNAPDLNAAAGVWPNKVILTTTGDNFLDSRNVYSIKCSGYYNGKYRLTVWYFGNFTNDGTDLKIILQRSDDGGATWTKTTLSPSDMPNNAIGNLSLASWTPVYNGTAMTMGCFYIKKNTATFASGFVGYDVYYIYNGGSGFTTDVKWTQNANSFDWTIHSISSFFLNNVQYCVISGFRNVLDAVGVNANYSLWVTGLINQQIGATVDLWSAPVAALPVGSASSINQNSFTFPSSTVVDGMAYITALATLVDSVSQTSQGNSAQVVTTHQNYIMTQSDDAVGFSYPSIFVGTDGTEFVSGSYASFVLQGAYWWLGGASGYLWEYSQNNIVADVTQDVIGYSISEQAGQPSSISLKLANANNEWVGASPTGAGAAAIARNRKIAIWQGFYNAAGVPEAVPRNVYYIDDIQQQVTGTQNDVLIVGRDLYKNLKTTVTKFGYQFVGPLFFTDIFDGTFTSSWNQVSGTWVFVASVNPPLLERTVSSGSEDKIMLVGTNGNSYGSLTRVFFRDAVSGGVPHSHVYIYAIYIDANNWLRLDIDTQDGSAWKVTRCIAGSQTDLDSGSLPSPLSASGSHYYGIYIRKYDYYKFNFIIDLDGNAAGNAITDYDPAVTSYLFKSSGTGEYDLSSTFNANASWQTGFTVGIGTINSGPSNFRFFFYTQYNSPTNLGTLIRRIARIAGVFAFKLTYTWRELLFQNNFNGGSIANRILTITAGNQAISNINQMSNGEVQFQAKATVANNSNPAGFSFIFRDAPDSSTQTDYYKLHVLQASTGFANPPIYVRFERYIQNAGKTYIFYNSPYDVSNNPTSAVGSNNIDITKWNNFRIVMIDGWMYAFINDVMVASWNDNNITWDYQTTGKWGFEADTNTTLQVQEIKAPDFWKPVRSFSYNPGDDAEGAIESLITSLRAWMFSDMLARFKVIFLNATDPSTYTYDNQLYQQNVDQSDKEYVSQVTVYGNGVVATARNTLLMSGVRTRDIVVVDYQITTQADAQTRANNVLINATQYLNQNASKQVINVGAELFDVVTVTNTGNNTSGVDGPTRVYDQTFEEGGGNNNSDFSLEIDTGNVS